MDDKKDEIGYDDNEEEWVYCPFDLDSKIYAFDDINIHYGYETVKYCIISNDDYNINY